jgi:NDP-sugar pyrophosphorylase family protein
MPVGDQPILEILIRQLESSGISHITIAVGHLAELVQAVLGNGDKFGITIDYAIEDKPLGTSGPLSTISDLNETFLVCNGDVLTNIDFIDLLDVHRKSGRCLTIATHKRKVFIDYGVVHNADGELLKYEEKPVIDYEVSMGIYVFEPQALQLLPPSGYMDFPDLVRLMLRRGTGVSIYTFDGIWYDLGREEDFRRVQEQLGELSREIPYLRTGNNFDEAPEELKQSKITRPFIKTA